MISKTQKERIAAKGFSIEDTYEGTITLRCSKNHRIVVKGYVNKETMCPICDGSRMDLEKLGEYLKSLGYQMMEYEVPRVLTEDRHGNLIIKASDRFDIRCGVDEGHYWRANISELRKGKRCPRCKGTQQYAGYSRSEDIIARTLDYLGIGYIRQWELPPNYESRLVDFYLPQDGVIIEHDGEHHKYGRNKGSDKDSLTDTKKGDEIRNSYARDKGIKLHRIEAEGYMGKDLIYTLISFLQTIGYSIDYIDPYYDSIVEDAYSYAHERFGWLPYHEIKEVADIRIGNSLSKTAEITGKSMSVVSKYFKCIHGMTYQNYKKYGGSPESLFI